MATMKEGISKAAEAAKNKVTSGLANAQTQASSSQRTRKKDEKIEKIKAVYSALPPETRRQYAQKVQQAIGQNVDSFSREYDSMINHYNHAVGRNSYVSASESDRFSSSLNRRASSLRERANKFNDLMDIFGADMDEDFRDQYNKMIGSTNYGINEMLRGAESRRNYYSQFKDEAEFNQYQIGTPLNREASKYQAFENTKKDLNNAFQSETDRSTTHMSASGKEFGGSHGSFDGEKIYQEKRAQKDEAKGTLFERWLDLLGTGAAIGMQAQAGPINPSEQAALVARQAEDIEQIQAANEQYKEANKINDWYGRDDLVSEYKKLLWLSTISPYGQNAERLKEVRAELEAKDRAAGNAGENGRSYGIPDTAGNILIGAGEKIGSAAANTFSFIGKGMEEQEAKSYTPQQLALDVMTGQDPTVARQAKAQAYEEQGPSEVWNKVDAVADTLGNDASAVLQKAKEGKSALGEAGVDIAENVIEMGFDAGVASMTGGSALVPMFFRVFGESIGEARQAGATLAEQGGYALTSAGIEMATEVMFDGVAKIYGAGAADEITEEVIRRLTESDTGRSVLRLIIGASGEGVEEVVSDLLHPLAESIYNEDTLKDGYWAALDPAEIVYDFLIGAAVGMLGSSMNIVNGGDAQANTELAMRDAGIGSAENKASAAWDVLSGRITAEEQSARADRAMEKLGLKTKAQKKAAVEEGKYVAPKSITQEDVVTTIRGAQEKLKARGVTDDKTVKAVAAVVLQEKADRMDAVNDSPPTRNQQRIVDESAIAQQVVRELDAEAITEEGKAKVTWQDKRADITLNGESVKIVGAENGKVVVEQNGETKSVDSKDLKGLSDSYRNLVDIASTMEGGTAMLEAYQPGQDIKDYARAWNRAYSLYGAQTDMRFEKAREYGKSTLRALTDAQLKKALLLGRDSVQEKGPVQREALTGKVGYWQGGKLEGVEYDAVTEEEARQLLGDGEMSLLADALTSVVNVTLVKSKAGEGGKFEGAQGVFYNNGHIYLDVNAGMIDAQTGQRTVVLTAAHELTHFIRAYNEDGYKALRSFITSELVNKGLSLDRLVAQKRARSKTKMSYDEAMEEVIADACETMLTDTSKLKAFAEAHPAEARTIGEWLGNFLDKISNAFTSLKTAHTEAEAMQDRIEELRKMWFEALAQANKNATAMEASDPSEVVQEHKTDTGFTSSIQSEGNVMMSLRTFEEDGRANLKAFLDEQVQNHVFSEEEARQMMEQIEELYKVCKDYDNGEYEPFSAWSNAEVISIDGKPVFSVVKQNGEYKLNLDFSLVCKKRRTLDAVFNEMIKRGIMNDFRMGQGSIAKINEIIRDHGFEVACGLCFVDSKRYRQAMIADAFCKMYNMQVFSLMKGTGAKVDSFNFGGDATIINTGEGIDTLPDSKLNWEKVDEILRTEKKGTVKYKIADHLKNNPQDRKLVSRGDFMSTAGFDQLKIRNPELLSIYNSKKGAGGPKAAQSDVQYLNEIIQQGQFNVKDAYEVGGVRIQSFSDYVGRLVFDYVQMVADLSAKKLPAHSYTKEFMFAQQFGLTGIKINMSLVPEVVKGIDKDHAGLDADGNYTWKDGQSFGSTVYDNNGKRLTANEGFELAKKIQNAEGYSKNCGTIAVGVSRAHIEKMLDDPEIRMIIPYHKSGLNHLVAAMNQIDKYTDYTNVQNTREFKNGKWSRIPAAKEFNWNDTLQRMQAEGKGAKEAAKAYLDWCTENGYKAKFDEFAGHPNYYKLLEDFSCYDKDGTTSTPLGAVQMNFPTESDAFGSMKDLIKAGLEEDAMLQAKQEGGVDDIVDEIQSVLPEWEAAHPEGKKAKATVKLSAREATEATDVETETKTISEDMTEEERYEVLKDKKITVYPYNPDRFAELQKNDYEELNKLLQGEYFDKTRAFNLLRTLGKNFKTFKDYFNKDISVTFEYSISSLRHSNNKQESSEAASLAKLFTVFDQVIENAIGIEAHGDRYNYTKRVKSSFEKMYVLFSAYKDGQEIIPVRAEVNIYSDKTQPKLDVVVTMSKINEADVIRDTILGESTGNSSPRSASTYMLADLLRNVNPEDTGLLKYIPDGFLDDQRFDGKLRGIENTEEYKAAKERRKAEKAAKKSDREVDYQRRALVSEETIDKWLKDYAASNPNYAQAYITYMSPDQFLELTTLDKASRDRIFMQSQGLSVETALKFSKGQPVQLRIDTETGKVIGHEGRHRMIALKRGGIEAVPVLLFDSSNKYSKAAMETLTLSGQDFNDRTNMATATVTDIQPFSTGNRDALVDKFSRQTKMETLYEKYGHGENAAFSLRDTEAVRRQQAKDRARLNNLRAEKNAKIESVRQEEIAKRRAAIKKEKEAKWKKVAETEQKYRDMMSRQRDTRNENAGQAKYRAQVAEKAERLNKMLLTNSDKLHVPEVLKKPLAEFLSSIDFSSKSMLTKGTETRADVKFQNALMALNDVLARQERYLNGEEDVDVLAGYFDISAESMDYLREMTEQIHQMMQDAPQGDGTDLRGKFAFTVNAMTAEQLKGLSKLLSNITSAIRNMNSFMANERYQTVREAAEADITYMDSLGKASEVEQSGFADALAWKNGTPYYVLKRFGQGGKAVFDSFARGWERMAFNAKKIIDFTEKVYTDKEVKDWKKEVHDITLSNGARIKMTTAQIMELSRLLGREQAMKHIEKGGIRIDNIKGKVGNIVDTNHYHLTMEDIAHLMQELTPRQMEVARALQQFMAKQGATWGNEVSMRRFGYNFYDEGDAYYPIRTDSNDRGMQDTEAMQNSMFRLLNLSASKSLNPKASNALIVGDIFDTFADHMADMAKLNGMGLPILDAIKWFNYKERIDLGGGEYDTRTLQGAMERAFGAQAQRYFRTLMKDINGVTEAGDRGTDLASRFISNYKAASVAANLRVAFLQPTSYVRAAAIIDPKFLALAFTNRNAYKEAIANSGTAVWKSLGYYDTNISRGMREQIEHNASWKDKVVEASMSLAELGDKVTWGRLWVACKMQAKARNNSLEGQSLINATADLFREVVYATQVMDSTLTRSELMRGKTLYTKAMTAFMAEPTLSYNLLIDAFGTFNRDVKRLGKQEAWKQNNGKIYTAISTYVASAAFAAVVESVADAFRDDDNDEFWQKFLEALFGEGVVARIKGEKSTESILKSVISGNLAQDLTIIGKIPYVKSMISTLQGYKSKDMTSAAFDAIIDSVKIWQETAQLANGKLDKPTKVTYYGNMTDWGKVYKSLQALSQLTGLGASNLARDVLAIWNATAGEIHPDWKVKTYQSKSERTYLDTVYSEGVSWSQYDAALKGMDADENGSYKQDEAGPYLNGEVAAGRMTQEQAEAIWRAVGPTWKKTLAEWTEKNS